MSRVSCVLCLVLLAVPGLLAQTTASGSVRGTAVDQQQGALPGLTVTVTSSTVPGVRTALTDSHGEYRFDDLPPGTYTLTAELQGFNKVVREPIIISAGLNVRVDLEMPIGALTETVEVRQEAPLLESRSAIRAVNISGEMMKSIPLGEHREWFGAVLLAPGVTTMETVNNEKIVYVHGAEYSSTVVQIDGAEMTPALGATLRYNTLNADTIDDMQIKTAGVDASAPLGLGAIINIATASGTNHVKGAATVLVQPRAWNGSNTPGGTSGATNQKQVDLSLGAPIIKDRMWAYGAYRGVDAATGVSRTAAQLEALRALVPGFAPFDSTNVANVWFGKINAQLAASHQFSAFVQHDVNPVSFADPVTERSREEATGGTGASLRLRSVWSDHFTTRIGASYNDKRRDVLHADEYTEPLERVYQGTIASGGRLLGNGRIVDRGAPLGGGSKQPNSRITLSLDATLTAAGRWGSHEVQTGVYAQPRIQVAQRDFSPNGGFVFEEAVLRQPGSYDAGVIPFHRLIVDGVTNLRVRRHGRDYAAYVQDAWSPIPRLTINPGVRIDHIVWIDQLFNVTSERATAIGPRLGVNYVLTADTRNVVTAHWVRVHDQASETGTSVGTSALSQHDLFDLNLDGTFETVFDTPATFAVTPGRSIDPDLHQPFVNEWGAGYTRQLPGQLTAGVDVVHRAFRDRTALVETNSRYEGLAFAGFIDETFNQLYQVANNRWNWPVYSSLELTLTKRSPRLQALASYVRQWRHIAGTWQPNDPALFIQPDAFANDRGIGSPRGSTGSTTEANSLSGTNMTAAGQWHDHSVRGALSWRAPWSVLVATTYTLQSGGWSGPIITRIPAADPAFGPATVTLSNGRRVSNPLATTLRFAGANRGDGQLTTPMLHVWNVRAGRRFSVRKLDVDVSLDVFNVANSGADQQFQFAANQTYNPLFGSTQFKQLPRSAQANIRIAF